MIKLLKKRSKSNIILKSWEIRNLNIYFHGINRHFDLECFLTKIYLNDVSSFRKYILGYRDYSYQITVITKEPLKGNGYTLCGIDIVGKPYLKDIFYIEFKNIRRGKEPDLTTMSLNYQIQTELYNHLKETSRKGVNHYDQTK